jgi:hypothetical protein
MRMPRFIESLVEGVLRRRVAVIGAIALIAASSGTWFVVDSLPKRPPSIFDNAVDDVFGYLTEEDFSRLSIEERTKFLVDLMERFRGFSQSESAVAAAFFAGLSGPTSEKLMHNARILGKDVLVEGAEQFFQLQDQKDRDAFIDTWIIKWVRFADGATNQTSNMTDQQILDEFARQGRRDLERGVQIDAQMAQQIIDFWERDVSSVASPVEQAQIYQFLPAIRQRLLSRQGGG